MDTVYKKAVLKSNLYLKKGVKKVAITLSLRKTFILAAFLLCHTSTSVKGHDSLSIGPIYDHFGLTFDSGHRTEIMGPLFYDEQRDSAHLWALPPLFSHLSDPSLELKEWDLLYPLMSYDQYGDETRWHLFQVLSWATGRKQDADVRSRFTLFPLYFHQFSTNKADSYFAIVPFYGHLQNRLFRDEIKFILFPLYSQTRKRDVVTDNYLYPLFHKREGKALFGWQFWPLIGHEERGITYQTNAIGEQTIAGGHENLFVLWPFYFNTRTGIGTTNEVWQNILLPFYSLTRSPMRDSSTYLWPFGLTLTHDREKKYREIGMPWPLIVLANGEGKQVIRLWPLFSQARSKSLESDFYLWPLYKRNKLIAESVERERTRILFFLYSDITELNKDTGQTYRRTDQWPLFTAQKGFDGSQKLQVLALLEPLLPNSKSITRNYSQLWSLWRSEKNAKTGAESESILWNLYRFQKNPDSQKTSALFGLFQETRDKKGANWRLFYVPLKGKPAKKQHERTE